MKLDCSVIYRILNIEYRIHKMHHPRDIMVSIAVLTTTTTTTTTTRNTSKKRNLSMTSLKKDVVVVDACERTKFLC